MLTLYKFYEDFGRMGDLSGVFIADSSEVKKILGRKIYFGEVLGKHSDVSTKIILDDNLTILSQDQTFIEKFQEVLGEDFQTGLNPLDYSEI